MHSEYHEWADRLLGVLNRNDYIWEGGYANAFKVLRERRVRQRSADNGVACVHFASIEEKAKYTVEEKVSGMQVRRWRGHASCGADSLVRYSDLEAVR